MPVSTTHPHFYLESKTVILADSFKVSKPFEVASFMYPTSMIFKRSGHFVKRQSGGSTLDIFDRKFDYRIRQIKSVVSFRVQ
jgi:hypothetical protein